MDSFAANENLADRRYFIGGSDARVIMGDDEAALLRLWRENGARLSRRTFSGNLIVQLGVVTSRSTAIGSNAVPASGQRRPIRIGRYPVNR